MSCEHLKLSRSQSQLILSFHHLCPSTFTFFLPFCWCNYHAYCHLRWSVHLKSSLSLTIAFSNHLTLCIPHPKWVVQTFIFDSVHHLSLRLPQQVPTALSLPLVSPTQRYPFYFHYGNLSRMIYLIFALKYLIICQALKTHLALPNLSWTYFSSSVVQPCLYTTMF